MQKPRKRKQHQLPNSPPSKPSSSKSERKSVKITNGLKTKKEEKNVARNPYPDHPYPSPDECLSIRDDLLAIHGFPKEFAKYRKQRLTDPSSSSSQITNGDKPHDDGMKSELLDLDDDHEEEVEEESVLDGLVKTVLSQNTTEVNCHRAFASLKAAFPTWDHVLSAESKSIEDAIRCGGLAPTKASCINNVLSCLLEKRGKLCLEYLRDLPIDEIKAELSNFKGIGPKTVACVLMFHLQLNDFPVDTHVFEIAKVIGWVPNMADRNKTYLHLNQRIPDHLKFDLNCLLYTHGKVCRKCTEKGSKRQGNKVDDGNSCPLLNYCKNV